MSLPNWWQELQSIVLVRVRSRSGCALLDIVLNFVTCSYSRWLAEVCPLVLGLVLHIPCLRARKYVLACPRKLLPVFRFCFNGTWSFVFADRDLLDFGRWTRFWACIVLESKWACCVRFVDYLSHLERRQKLRYWCSASSQWTRVIVTPLNVRFRWQEGPTCVIGIPGCSRCRRIATVKSDSTCIDFRKEHCLVLLSTINVCCLCFILFKQNFIFRIHID